MGNTRALKKTSHQKNGMIVRTSLFGSLSIRKPRFWLLQLCFLCSLHGSDRTSTQAWKLSLGRRRNGIVESNGEGQAIAGEQMMTVEVPVDVDGSGSSHFSKEPIIGKMPSSVAASAAAVAEEQALIKPYFQHLYDQYWTIISYKPPVGIVTLLVMTHLIVSGRLFRLYPDSGARQNSVEAALQKQQQKYNSNGRSYVLDVDDANYQLLGGIDCVRQKLVRTVLVSRIKSQLQSHHPSKSNMPNFNEKQLDPLVQHLVDRVVHVLSISCKPGYLRTYVQQMIPYIAEVESIFQTITEIQEDEELYRVLEIGIHSAEIRITDALLRACRNRLLRTTNRL